MLRAVSAALMAVATVQGCTIVAVGKDAGGGRAFLSHTDDAGGGTQDVRLVRVPAADHEAGSMRPVYGTNYPYPRLAVVGRGEVYEPLEGQTPSVPVGFTPQVHRIDNCIQPPVSPAHT